MGLRVWVERGVSVWRRRKEGRKKEKRRMDEADKSGRSVGVGESKVNSEQRASV